MTFLCKILLILSSKKGFHKLILVKLVDIYFLETDPYSLKIFPKTTDAVRMANIHLVDMVKFL
jgi:hypothetical protein